MTPGEWTQKSQQGLVPFCPKATFRGSLNAEEASQSELWRVVSLTLQEFSNQNIDVTDITIMFISDEACMVGLPGFPGLGRTAWRMVERDSEDFWYHVRFRICEGAGARFKKFMPSDPSMLTYLLSQRSPEHKIEVVQVVTPACINGGSLEQMEKLISAIVSYDGNGECVLLHKVDSGAIYSSSPGVTDAGLLRNIRTIYDAFTAAGKHFHCTNCQTPNRSATTTAAG